jgi:lysophospholipase L1-like esterase
VPSFSRARFRARFQAIVVVAAALVVAIVVGVYAFVIEPQQNRAVLERAAATAPPVATQAATSHPVAAGPQRAVFIGDSYTAGAGAAAGRGWVQVLADEKGWKVTNLGRGGTGYATRVESPIAHEACGADVCPAYGEMISEAVKTNPDVVVVAGGRNDGAVLHPELTTAVTSFYKALRAAAPNARIIALSPVWAAESPQPDPEAFKAHVKGAAIAVRAEFVDLGEPLAGHPELITQDNVHPNTAGHAALARAAAKAIRD